MLSHPTHPVGSPDCSPSGQPPALVGDPARQAVAKVGDQPYQGLAAVGGHIYPVWSGNLNGGADGKERLDIFTATATIAVGPRILTSTMGPVSLSDDAFKHDGGESIFSLPNGFQAYYLNTAKGDRLDKGPTEIVLDDSQLDRAVTDGISCFGCHNQGIRQGTDEIRKHVLGDRTFSKEVREQVEALYPTPEEFKAQLDEDATRFRNAMIRAGLDPEVVFNAVKGGLEIPAEQGTDSILIANAAVIVSFDDG